MQHIIEIKYKKEFEKVIYSKVKGKSSHDKFINKLMLYINNKSIKESPEIYAFISKAKFLRNRADYDCEELLLECDVKSVKSEFEDFYSKIINI